MQVRALREENERIMELSNEARAASERSQAQLASVQLHIQAAAVGGPYRDSRIAAGAQEPGGIGWPGFWLPDPAGLLRHQHLADLSGLGEPSGSYPLLPSGGYSQLGSWGLRAAAGTPYPRMENPYEAAAGGLRAPAADSDFLDGASGFTGRAGAHSSRRPLERSSAASALSPAHTLTVTGGRAGARPGARARQGLQRGGGPAGVQATGASPDNDRAEGRGTEAEAGGARGLGRPVNRDSLRELQRKRPVQRVRNWNDRQDL